MEFLCWFYWNFLLVKCVKLVNDVMIFKKKKTFIQRGGQDRERSASRDSNSGRLKLNGVICQCVAHEAIGGDHLLWIVFYFWYKIFLGTNLGSKSLVPYYFIIFVKTILSILKAIFKKIKFQWFSTFLHFQQYLKAPSIRFTSIY